MHKYKFGYIAFLLVFTFAVVVNAQTASDQAVTSVAPSRSFRIQKRSHPTFGDRFVPPPEFNRQQVPPPPGGQFDDRRSQPIENWDNHQRVNLTGTDVRVFNRNLLYKNLMIDKVNL